MIQKVSKNKNKTLQKSLYSTFQTMEGEDDINFGSFHSVLSQNDPIDPDNIIKYNNSTTQQPSTYIKFDQQAFVPKRNLFYCYFTEGNSRNKKSKLDIKNASDIQRFCYYPKTSNIYTFIGFSNQEQRDQATRNRKLINYSTSKIIYKFVQNLQEILNFYQKKPKSIERTSIEKETESRKTKEFSPKEKLTYFYFHEQKKSDAERLRDLQHPIYHIFNATDVQLYRYYPGTKKLCSFFGFLNKDEGIHSFKKSKTVLHNYRIKIISNSKFSNNQTKIDFAFFHPIENLFYCFLIEIQKPSFKYLNIKFDRLFGIDNADDIQRFCYHPDTNKISTFIGFSDKGKLFRAVQKTSLKSAAVNREIYLYSPENKIEKNQNNEQNSKNDEISYNKEMNQTKNEDKKISEIREKNSMNNESSVNNSTNNEIAMKKSIYNDIKDKNSINNESSVNNSTNNEIALKNSTNNEITFNKDKNTLFKPNFDLYYVYFIENESNDEEEIFFDIDDIKDIQRNCKIRRSNPIHFTFLGFIQSIQRYYAIRALQKKTSQIDTRSIKVYDEDYLSEYEYEADETESEKEANSNSIENPNKQTELETNTQFHYSPNPNLTNDQFHYTPSPIQNNCSNLTNSQQNQPNMNSKSIQKIDSNKTRMKSKFIYSPDSESSKNITIKNDNDNNHKQEFSLPIFNSYNCGFKFMPFIPKDNIFYCFLAEINRPTYHAAFDGYSQIFGIQNASDIQRFRFYPGTENVYSFIGFSDQSKLNLAVQKQSVKSAAVGGRIFRYPYESNSQKNQDFLYQSVKNSNQQNTQADTIDKKSRKAARNKFVYNPEPDFGVTQKEEEELSNRNRNDHLNNKFENSSEKNENKNGENNLNNDKRASHQNSHKNENNTYTKCENDSDDADIFDANEKNCETKYVNDHLHNHNNKNDTNTNNINNFDENSSDNDNKNDGFTNDDADNFDADEKNSETKYVNDHLNNHNDKNDTNTNNINNFDENSSDNDNDNKNDGFTNDDADSPTENDQKGEIFFDANDDLLYLYFRENDSKIENQRISNTKLFNVANIKDLQRGFRVSKLDDTYYTFFGFSQSIDLANAFRILQEQNEAIDISSIQTIDEDEDENENYNDNDDDDDDDYDENDWEDGDEDFDFDFDDEDIETFSEEVTQKISRTNKVSPEEKIRLSNK